MIATVRGTLMSLSGGRAVIEVGGVGFRVAVADRFARSLRVGDTVLVHTALIVREDELSLFGFADETELTIFELLRTVSGVGPKSALGILNAMTPDAIIRAIADDNDSPFRAVSGIGPKTAKLIVVSLAGKLALPAGAAGDVVAPASGALDRAATTTSLATALTGLGWSEKTAIDAARTVVENDPDATEAGLPVLLRRALSVLGPAVRADEPGGRS